jgi:hypothetical protein
MSEFSVTIVTVGIDLAVTTGNFGFEFGETCHIYLFHHVTGSLSKVLMDVAILLELSGEAM